jgi:HlyD family secretion protein
MQAKANLMNAKAQKIQLQAKMTLAKNNYDRSVRLRPENVIAESEFDSAKAEYEAASANLNAADSAIAQAEAQIASAEASRDSARRNLEYCTIKSPVNGVIIDRRVNIGQTVVSSMSASSLFLIAKDLKKMEIWVSVNEADIGNIFVGQKAQFKVDAFPGKVFYGKVCKVRLNASMSQNVVTYVVEVATDNTDGKLLPYLTANVDFVLDERQNVKLVPAAALRYMPEEKQITPDQQELYQARMNRKARLVWTLRDGKLQAVKVKTGLSNGLMTEVVEGDIKPGDKVITGVVRGAVMGAGKAGGGSPFMPKPPQRRNENRAQESQRAKNAAARGM